MQNNGSERLETLPDIRVFRILIYLNPKLTESIQEKFGYTDSEMEALHQALMQFLIIKWEYGEGAPSSLIDDAWHEFILRTNDYVKFCALMFGRYVHHTPADKDADLVKLRELQQLTRNRALQRFETISRFWNEAYQPEPNGIKLPAFADNERSPGCT